MLSNLLCIFDTQKESSAPNLNSLFWFRQKKAPGKVPVHWREVSVHWREVSGFPLPLLIRVNPLSACILVPEHDPEISYDL